MSTHIRDIDTSNSSRVTVVLCNLFAVVAVEWHVWMCIVFHHVWAHSPAVESAIADLQRIPKYAKQKKRSKIEPEWNPNGS